MEGSRRVRYQLDKIVQRLTDLAVGRTYPANGTDEAARYEQNWPLSAERQYRTAIPEALTAAALQAEAHDTASE